MSTPSCQKCLQTGHWTYQCKQTTSVYLSRPSRTELMKNPRLQKKFLLNEDDVPKVPRITDGDRKRDPILYEEFRSKLATEKKDPRKVNKVGVKPERPRTVKSDEGRAKEEESVQSNSQKISPKK
eukprot:Protomagalhaensia_sp_Gyna_25__3102@NODE_2844_length_861_cov_137_069343_g2373_i0_p2_GENE_NODE_2844_length_861_cov_137_069343_g2373_i0NODE_2844_length_861_cov_137_069343_g2373_i0_p2_ORF_typecomplete_len125_score21_55zfCCHC_3/PF13917_6/2_1e11zfCCHC_5/PF14787_6/0_06_NODE_2844_length_861_cov_137_069343_g2373_i036410